MGVNVGGIYVKVNRPEIDQDAVVREVTRYWLGRGAKEDQRDPLELEPLSLEETGRLGYAIFPAMDDWIPVYDSERYQADHDLAKALSEALETETWWYQVAEAAGSAIVRRFGAEGAKPPETVEEIVKFVGKNFPMAFLYFNNLKDQQNDPDFSNVRLLAFRGILPSSDSYYSGATPEAIARAEHLFSAKKAALAGNLAAVMELLDERPGLAPEVLKTLGNAFDANDSTQRKTMLAIAKEAISRKYFDDSGLVVRFFKAALREDDQEFLKLVREQVSPDSAGLGEELSILGYFRMIDGRYKTALEIFDLALQVKELPKEAYCNALYSLLPSNTGLPLDRKSAHTFLKKCLPAGPRNPAIFRNAACVYAVLGDLKKAMENVRLAAKHGYDKMGEMAKDVELKPLLKLPEFMELIAGRKPPKKPAKKKPVKKKPAKKPAKKKPAKKPAKKKPAKKKKPVKRKSRK